jgi:hypothetical protein
VEAELRRLEAMYEDTRPKEPAPPLTPLERIQAKGQRKRDRMAELAEANGLDGSLLRAPLFKYGDDDRGHAGSRERCKNRIESLRRLLEGLKYPQPSPVIPLKPDHLKVLRFLGGCAGGVGGSHLELGIIRSIGEYFARRMAVTRCLMPPLPGFPCSEDEALVLGGLLHRFLAPMVRVFRMTCRPAPRVSARVDLPTAEDRSVSSAPLW